MLLPGKSKVARLMSEKSFENFFVNVVWNVIYLGIGERVSKYRLVQNHPDVEVQDGVSLLDWADKDECYIC